MALDRTANIYSKCDPIKVARPKFEIDEKLYKKICTGYRLLPTFESTLFDTINKRYYSLQKNERLKCRWSQYKQNIESRVFAPFQFPDIRELHFYNCAIRIRPDASIHNMNHRLKLKPGPGADSEGRTLPIPQDAMMKRGVTKKVPPKNSKATESIKKSKSNI